MIPRSKSPLHGNFSTIAFRLFMTASPPVISVSSRKIADLIVTLIRGGAPVGPSFIPDGSVGIQWGKHWTDDDLDGRFGTRIKYEHEYPPNFPQSASNPQHVWCYPDASLPEFRRWAREHYIPHCLPGYLGGKEKQGLLPPSFTQLAIEAIQARKDIPQISK
jgi:hypothetical protein